MSHIHIPDGVLPLWLILVGWLLAAAFVGLAAYRLRGEGSRGVPTLGVLAAVMLVGMSTEIVPIAYHVNLSVLAGIVLGPAYGFLAALIVNLILALLGHGGITVVGLNTLVVGSETALGFYLFRGLLAGLGRLGKPSPAVAAGLATGLTLFVSTWLLIGVVWASSVDPGHARDTGALDPATLTLANPFAGGLVSNRVVNPEREAAPASAQPRMDIWLFARAVLILGFLGWILEGAITGAIVGFVDRVRPDLTRGRRRGRPLVAG